MEIALKYESLKPKANKVQSLNSVISTPSFNPMLAYNKAGKQVRDSIRLGVWVKKGQ